LGRIDFKRTVKQFTSFLWILDALESRCLASLSYHIRDDRPVELLPEFSRDLDNRLNIANGRGWHRDNQVNAAQHDRLISEELCHHLGDLGGSLLPAILQLVKQLTEWGALCVKLRVSVRVITDELA
jgi:hypothetical protein